MKSGTVIFGGLCFAVGAVAGAVLGGNFVKKRYDEEITQRHNAEREEAKKKEEEKKVEVGPEIKKEVSTPTVTEKDYKQYNKIIENSEYAPKGEDITDEVNQYEKQHGKEIKVIDPEVYDPDVYPTGPRETPELYYFVHDHILSTEEGEEIDSGNAIYDPFFNSYFVDSDDEHCIIVDNRNEIDYHVTRISDSYESWFPPED